MKVIWIISCLLFVPFLNGQSAIPSPATASAANVPPRQFTIELEVPAALPAVWEAFSTSDGVSTWLGPHATVDLRAGGDWLVHFPNGSTGGGTIVRFVPQKELVLSALAPDQFPHVRAERTLAVFEFEARGKATVVRLTQSGWKDDPEWDRAYEYLLAGNAQLLSGLHHRFVAGPVDWDKVFAGR